MKTSLEEYRTNKFICKRCKNNDMLPNKEGDFIKGFRCEICGEINYPASNKTNKNEVIFNKMFKTLKKMGCKMCDNFNACFIEHNFKPCENAQHWQWNGITKID